MKKRGKERLRRKEYVKLKGKMEEGRRKVFEEQYELQKRKYHKT